MSDHKPCKHHRSRRPDPNDHKDKITINQTINCQSSPLVPDNQFIASIFLIVDQGLGQIITPGSEQARVLFNSPVVNEQGVFDLAISRYIVQESGIYRFDVEIDYAYINFVQLNPEARASFQMFLFRNRLGTPSLRLRETFQDELIGTTADQIQDVSRNLSMTWVGPLETNDEISVGVRVLFVGAETQVLVFGGVDNDVRTRSIFIGKRISRSVS